MVGAERHVGHASLASGYSMAVPIGGPLAQP
jgi:hypothetical protein